MSDRSFSLLKQQLKDNKPISSLQLYSCKLTQLREILSILKSNTSCRNLTTPYFWPQDYLDDEICLLIAEVIAHNQILTKICIQGAASKEFNYSQKSFPLIAEKLSQNQNLKHFFWPHLENESLPHFVQAIGLNESLQEVMVCCTEISLNNSKILAEEISKNKALHSIDFYKTPLGDDGLIEITKAISIHPKIRRLSFCYCNIGDVGAEAFAKCLQNHKTLVDVNLSCNRITDQGIFCISEAFKINKKIKIVDLKINQSSSRNITLKKVSPKIHPLLQTDNF